ncbi:hypothetical protein GCM10009687_58690 [Asanoa iriomotensis]|uniref:Uncharacterized protein n=1 Tax=Asanoa iriomotensis TaxID=234613 RepID=A0ABQ4BU58_9ACTN|nr:hypothetical protein Air01nite_01580 [Asanoa iriomotensis]
MAPLATFWPTVTLIEVTVPLVPNDGDAVEALRTEPDAVTVLVTVPRDAATVRVVLPAAPAESLAAAGMNDE